MADVRIKDLPSGTPSQSKKLPMDLTTAESATIKDIVYAGRPAASQAEAEAGTDADKVMTPLTTFQAVQSILGIPGAAGLAILAKTLASEVRDYIGAPPASYIWRAPLSKYNAVGDGITDDTIAVSNALAAGVPLTGQKRVYAVTGKISLPAGADLEDIEFKQLSPGASLNVITLEADGVDNIRLVRVKINRNGNGTNGGLLNASGVNGALNTAFGLRINGGKNHYIQDVEAYGDDSGTLLGFIGLDGTSKIIRPYAHDAKWSRTAATDDQVQGVYFYECSNLLIESPKIERLTGILNGVASRRFTRAIPMGASTACTIRSHYIYNVDQGIDITGSVGNRYIRIEFGVSSDCYTFPVKLANTAQYCVVSQCVGLNCGSSFVAAGNAAYSSDIRTSDCTFIDCYNINVGATGQTVIGKNGFYVIGVGSNAEAARIKFIRCYAYDFQVSPTMEYAFASQAPAAIAAMMQDCGWFGYTNSVPTAGVFDHPEIKQGSGNNGRWTKFPDGTMECYHSIDLTAVAISTAAGNQFTTVSAQTWTFEQEFIAEPVFVGSFARNDGTIGGYLSLRTGSTTGVTFQPFLNSSVGAGNAKLAKVRAIGRWK